MRFALSRRNFLAGSVSMIAGAQNLRPAVAAVDHLLLGVSDLDRGIAWVEQRTGIRAAIGGAHPGIGTRNALLSLGARHYLEIIAPDPAQSAYNFQIDVRPLAEPRLITWAAATNDIEAVAKAARDAGHQLFGPRPGSRQTPSGKLLRWRSLGVVNKFGVGGVEPVPFFIEWAPDSPHPSQDSPFGCELQSVHLQHPDSSALAAALKGLGIEIKVAQAGTVRLTASLKTPKGHIELG
jgi:Glyoxalase-like domain